MERGISKSLDNEIYAENKQFEVYNGIAKSMSKMFPTDENITLKKLIEALGKLKENLEYIENGLASVDAGTFEMMLKDNVRRNIEQLNNQG